MSIFEKVGSLDQVLFLGIYSLMCIFISIGAAIWTLKNKENASFKEKFQTIFYAVYFSIFMALLPWTLYINVVLGLLIFLHLFLIGAISYIKKYRSLLSYVWTGLCILGMYMCVCNLLNCEFSVICWYILGIGIYFVPGLCFFESKKDIFRRIKKCTKEVDVQVVKIMKGYDDDNRRIYIPVLEIDYNGKKHTYMDSQVIYSRNITTVENITSVFINPNNPNLDTMFGSDDVFLPGPFFKDFRKKRFGVILFYVSTLSIFILCFVLNVLF